MERNSTQQYCGEDGVEFSLPEGVDLVGIDNNSSRKPSGSYQHPQAHAQQHGSGGGGNSRKKAPSWKAAAKLIIINIFVCGLVLGYALIGSFVFLALEGHKNHGSPVQVSASGYPVRRTNLSMDIWNTLEHAEEIQQLKNDTVKNIWDITLSMNILYQDNWTRLTADEVSSFQRNLIEKILHVVESRTSQEPPYAWTFPRAFLFALTTLTTIGYGGIGPKTSSAKIATMIYAIFGIPIMLWYLSNVGSLLAKIARYFCAKLLCCCCYDESRPRKPAKPPSANSANRKPNDSYYQMSQMKEGETTTLSRVREEARTDDREEEDEGFRPRMSILLILILSLGVLLGYVCFGSYVVARWEKWRFLDSFYFCFLTLTTISFGDVRAQKTGGLERFQARTEWFCSFYILFGMALTSMFFNILHEEISRRYKRWKTSPLDPAQVPENKEILATVNRNSRRRPAENSYSVHFMNFSPSNTTTRNFTEETLLQNEVHCKPRGLPCSDSANKSLYDDEEIPADYIVSHPIPPPREIYGSHPVFPR